MVMKNRYVKPDNNISVNNGLYSVNSNLVDLSGKNLYIKPPTPLIEPPFLITQTPLLPSKVHPMPGGLPNSAIFGSSCSCSGSHSNSFSGVLSSASNLVNLTKAVLAALSALGINFSMQHLATPSPAPSPIAQTIRVNDCAAGEDKCINLPVDPKFGPKVHYIQIPNGSTIYVYDLNKPTCVDGVAWHKVKFNDENRWINSPLIDQKWHKFCEHQG
jgi:hypothetical protein